MVTPQLQGFASGDLERDATAVRMFTDAGVELILSQVRLYQLLLASIALLYAMYLLKSQHSVLSYFL